jgi:hypothetical protein
MFPDRSYTINARIELVSIHCELDSMEEELPYKEPGSKQKTNHALFL